MIFFILFYQILGKTFILGSETTFLSMGCESVGAQILRPLGIEPGPLRAERFTTSQTQNPWH